MIEIIALAGVGIILPAAVYKLLTPVRPTNFPPGPGNGYPVIGNLKYIAALNPRPALALLKLGEMYGPACGVYLGKDPCVIVSGWDAAKEVLTRPEFQNRPDFFLQRDRCPNGLSLGIGLTNGSLWTEQSGFCKGVLKDCGIKMEKEMEDEVADCIDFLKKQLEGTSNSVLQMEDIFKFSVINIVWALLCGKRHGRDDEEYIKFQATVEAFINSGAGFGSLINDHPCLRFFPPFSSEYKETQGNAHAVNDIIKKEIEEHRKTIDMAGVNPDIGANNLIIGIYLSKLAELQKTNADVTTYFSLDQLTRVCSDAFFAATVAMSSTLSFGMLYMLVYPDVQEKVGQEIEAVLGQRAPSPNDREKMPYVEAVLTELFRRASPVPISVPHCTSQDTKLLGFNIPKNTVLHVNLYSVHMEASFWKDPQIFRPERFLDGDGKFVQPERVIPFSMGARSCFGPSIAKTLHFLFFVGMIQQFKIERELGQPLPSLEPVPELTERPQPFKAKLTLRNPQ